MATVRPVGRRRATGGFTLIELLVVIAIIAVLAAILFPVFSRAREKARTASCQSNLKQIALAFKMYASDWDECYPFWRWGTEGGGGSRIPSAPQWYVRLYPYTKNAQIYQCPSQSRNGGCIWCYANPNDSRYLPQYPGISRINYGYNEVLTNGSGGQPISDSLIRYPAQTLLAGDCRASLGGWQRDGILTRYAHPKDPWCGCPPNMSTFYQTVEDAAAHSGGANIAFCDGHVKWIKWNQIGHGKAVYYWLP